MWEFGEIILGEHKDKFPISASQIATWMGSSYANIHDLISQRQISSKKKKCIKYIPELDYIKSEVVRNGHPGIEYFVSIDCFEDLCMRMRNPKSITIRKYFRIVNKLFQEYAQREFSKRSVSTKEKMKDLQELQERYDWDDEAEKLADGGSMAYLDKMTQDDGRVFWHPGSTTNAIYRKQGLKFEYPDAKHQWTHIHRMQHPSGLEQLVETLSEKWRVRSDKSPQPQEILFSEDYPADDVWAAAEKGLAASQEELQRRLKTKKSAGIRVSSVPRTAESNSNSLLKFKRHGTRHLIKNKHLVF